MRGHDSNHTEFSKIMYINSHWYKSFFLLENFIFKLCLFHSLNTIKYKHVVI